MVCFNQLNTLLVRLNTHTVYHLPNWLKVLKSFKFGHFVHISRIEYAKILKALN